MSDNGNGNTGTAEGQQAPAGGQQQGNPGVPSGTGQDPAGTAPNGQQTAEQGNGDHGTGQDPAATIARLERDLTAARQEAAKGRTTAKQRAADEAVQRVTQEIGRALGLVKDDEPADPQQLTRQLADAQAKARETAVELAVYRAAGEAGADPDALLDSRKFADAVANLDPADRDAIGKAIRDAVEADQRLAAKQPTGPARGGAEFNGAPSGGVTAAQFADMSYGERTRLYESDPDTYRRLAGTQ